MKALTVKQPWAQLLFTQHPILPDRGIKMYETRTWDSSYRGDLLITTSKKPDQHYKPIDEMRGVCRVCGCIDQRACPGGCYWANVEHDLCSQCRGFEKHGYAIGVVEMVNCFPFRNTPEYILKACCEFYPGYCFDFKNPRFIQPFEIKGKLGIWDADIEMKDLTFITPAYDKDDWKEAVEAYHNKHRKSDYES